MELHTYRIEVNGTKFLSSSFLASLYPFHFHFHFHFHLLPNSFLSNIILVLPLEEVLDLFETL